VPQVTHMLLNVLDINPSKAGSVAETGAATPLFLTANGGNTEAGAPADSQETVTFMALNVACTKVCRHEQRLLHRPTSV
jgi:hypothetical protein